MVKLGMSRVRTISFIYNRELSKSCFLFFSRVHVTQATLDCLAGQYEVEDGRGGERNQYLHDNHVKTYFIVPPERRKKVQ